VTGGVVGRDGLREAVTELRDKWLNESVLRELRPEWHAGEPWKVAQLIANDLSDVLDAVPDVPPDPPAAEVSELARAMQAAWRDLPPFHSDLEMADALLSSGVLLRVGDVRAQALEDAAAAAKAEFGNEQDWTWLRDRAVSEREGTT
jgi:hypothetical protein